MHVIWAVVVRESAILAAAAEAVEWSHPIEPRNVEGKRVASRVIIHPAEIPPLEEALSDFSRNPWEQEDGKHIACSKILQKSDEYESPPELAASVPLWMNIAAQVSTGTRPLVLEDGPDTMNSSDEESPKEEHGDVLTDMYTAGLKAPVLLSQSEVARQRAAAEHYRKAGYGK
jgi:hypothetical protein